MPELESLLLLADGALIEGHGAGMPALVDGELIFTTAMTGYQEALTDPSYRGQILMFTYPLIGNYGVSAARAQSPEIQARGAIVSTLSPAASAQSDLAAYLHRHDIPAMTGVDTRAIARHVREHGAMPAVLSVHLAGKAPDLAAMHHRLAACDYDDADLVSQTTVTQPELHGDGPLTIALVDCGNKRDVLAELLQRGVRVVVLPAHTPAEEILALNPSAVMISNGPGNPASTPVVTTVRALYGRIPLFGVCLGHQLIALAAGARTYKLRFGHRGANHPVIDENGRAFITTQNHGYAVDPDSLPGDLVVSHRHLNDNTVEGLRHRTLPIRSVQFHPEGAPGPRDAGVLLDEWIDVAGSLVGHGKGAS